jgi:hypothetical protein
MRGVYGATGYGWWWMLIEMMAESDGYQLDCKSKYAFNAYAMQLNCNSDDLQKFVTDCIVEFELFESDSMFFWSNSLRNRMRYRDAVAEKRAEAANARWNKRNDNANASESDANAMQKNANETKQNKTLINKKELRPKSQKKIYDEQSVPLRLAKYLLKNIREFKPDLKEPNLQSWADDMRKLIELDKRDPKQIGSVIEWVTKDSFWQVNVLSAATIRDKWDRLTAEMGKARYKDTEKKVVQIDFKPSEEDINFVRQAYANQ